MKWRGVLFLRFLLSLVDESEKIKQLANFLFSNILKGYKLFSCYHICYCEIGIFVFKILP